jgi:hypothetical protein
VDLSLLVLPWVYSTVTWTGQHFSVKSSSISQSKYTSLYSSLLTASRCLMHLCLLTPRKPRTPSRHQTHMTFALHVAVTKYKTLHIFSDIDTHSSTFIYRKSTLRCMSWVFSKHFVNMDMKCLRLLRHKIPPAVRHVRV